MLITEFVSIENLNAFLFSIKFLGLMYQYSVFIVLLLLLLL